MTAPGKSLMDELSAAADVYGADGAYPELTSVLRRAAAELTRLKAPLPDSRTTAEEKEKLRALLAAFWHDYDNDSMCRDCADEDGRCPNKHTPCNPYEALVEAFPRLAECLLDDLDAATARERVAVEALKPFALVAENDIGESEDDADVFRPIMGTVNYAPKLTVGDLRRAASIRARRKGETNG